MIRIPTLPRLALALALGASVATLALSPNATAQNAAADEVVARVNGVEITQAELEIAAQDPLLPLGQMPEEQRREVLIAYLIDLELGARAAEEAAVAEDPEFARQLEYSRRKLLLDALLERRVAEAVTEEAKRALYDETVAGIEPENEVRARHILVETREEAEEAIARLEAGEDFAALAGELSQDPGSGPRGGDLGFFARDRMVGPFAEAAFALEPGSVSEPVQTQFGWHVIRVEERRERPVPSFEQMSPQLEAFLARRAQQELILALREGAQIERLDAANGEAAPAPQ